MTSSLRDADLQRGIRLLSDRDFGFVVLAVVVVVVVVVVVEAGVVAVVAVVGKAALRSSTLKERVVFMPGT